MEASPEAFRDAKPFRLEFGTSEEPESTEDNPVLRYERNGFVFIAKLNVPQQTVDIILDTRRDQSLDKDVDVQASEVKKLAEAELIERWHRDGYFA